MNCSVKFNFEYFIIVFSIFLFIVFIIKKYILNIFFSTFQVSGIVGRADLLCALFVFIAFLCYVQAVNQSSSSVRISRYITRNKYVL